MIFNSKHQATRYYDQRVNFIKNIINKYAKKFNYTHKKELIACAIFQGDNLIEIAHFLKIYQFNRKHFSCGCYTAYYNGIYKDKVIWHCIQHNALERSD